MTLDSSSSAAAVAPAVEPHEQSVPAAAGPQDEDVCALAALLAEPSVVSSEESAPEYLTAASMHDRSAPVQRGSSDDDSAPDDSPLSTPRAVPDPAADSPVADAGPVPGEGDTPSRSEANQPSALPEGDALPDIILLPPPADAPTADTDAGSGDAPLGEGERPAVAVAVPDRDGPAAVEAGADLEDALLRDIADTPAVSSEHTASWSAEEEALSPDAAPQRDPAAAPGHDDAPPDVGGDVAEVPADEAGALPPAAGGTRLDEITATPPASTDHAAAPADEALPEAADEALPRADDALPGAASFIPRAGPASALEAAARKVAESAGRTLSRETDALARPAVAPGPVEAGSPTDADLFDDAQLRAIADAPAVTSDQLVLPTPAVAPLPDDADPEPIGDASPAPESDPAFDEASLGDIDDAPLDLEADLALDEASLGDLEGVAAAPPDVLDVPDTPADGDYGDLPLEAVPPGPAAALAFATDPDTELALRDGLFGYESATPDCGDPQVWQGGLRAAIAALSDGHSAQLIFVDVDGIPFPAGAIHELAAFCEVGTVVVAIGSDDSARPGRELLLAGVTDYLAKPLTAEAVRAVAARASPDAADGRPSGCVAGFIGSGGSGTTTLMTATALQAAARGCYVSVLDLNRSVAAAALALGVEPAAGLDQLLESAGRATPEAEMIEGVCAHRSDRIELYAHRWSPAPPPAPTPEALDSLLAALRLRSHLVLVDGFDEPELCMFPPVEVDRQVFVAEPTAGKAVHAARMIELVQADPPMLFVQNHTRPFKRGAGTRVLQDAGLRIEPDVVIPFEPSLPETADWGWPNARLPRSLRKPLATLTDRLLEPAPSVGALASAPLPGGS